MAIPELLAELLLARGPSGMEDAVMHVVRREAGSFADVRSDVHGNTIALVPGTTGGRTLALHAHADEIGMIVTHVHDDGLASVARVAANWDAGLAVGRRVVCWDGLGRSRALSSGTGPGDTAPAWTIVRLDIGATDSA